MSYKETGANSQVEDQGLFYTPDISAWLERLRCRPPADPCRLGL